MINNIYIKKKRKKKKKEEKRTYVISYYFYQLHSYSPEALGVVTGCIFLVTMFLFIPVPFTDYIFKNENFPHNEVN